MGKMFSEPRPLKMCADSVCTLFMSLIYYICYILILLYMLLFKLYNEKYDFFFASPLLTHCLIDTGNKYKYFNKGP